MYTIFLFFIFNLKEPSLKQRLLLMRRLLFGSYENSRRLIDACGHIYKKKCILVIFGKFKKRNPKKAPRVTCLCIIEEGFIYKIILGSWSYNILEFNI